MLERTKRGTSYKLWNIEKQYFQSSDFPIQGGKSRSGKGYYLKTEKIRFQLFKMYLFKRIANLCLLIQTSDFSQLFEETLAIKPIKNKTRDA